ncbi:MAG: mevalonate kinase [Polyangiales bacterium]
MARAFAKVILFGEHAVVHGRTAVAAAIERGAEARAEPSDRTRLLLHPWGRTTELGEDDDVSRAFGAVLECVGARAPLQITVDVGVPGGAGLGCSAAIAVSIARAAAEASNLALDDDRIAACANAWEKVFHGNPSGVDVAVAARGGVISFKRGATPKPVVPGGEMELAIAYTGEPSSTKSMVEAVARQLARRPQVVERTFDGIDTLAIKGAQAIEAGLWYEVGRLMDLNHALLSSLLVSTEEIERACHVARDTGAMGAKLTGGGGGGCVVALAPGKLDAVISAWKSAGFEAFSARVGRAVGS